MNTIKNQYWNFWFFQKQKKRSSFLNFGWMWLVNKLVLTFSAPIKCAQAQFNLIILSRVIEYTTFYRQTDRHFRKNHFFLTRGVSKRQDLMQISKVIFHIKLIPSHPWWEYKNVYYGGTNICLEWYTIFEVDNESKCFLEREW